MPKKRNHVYVIELRKAVLKERRFLEANRLYFGEKPCVYVGRTGRTPKQRFEQHKKGYKANRYAKEYCVCLLPELYEHLNPMTYTESVEMEKALAQDLRSQGYGVWQK